MKKSRIKKGDKIIVLAGDDKGKVSTVLEVFPKKSRAIVKGVNIVKKHIKPTANNPQSGIVKQEASIHLSNLSVFDPQINKPSRVGFRIENSKKSRFFKKSGALVVDEIKKEK